MPAAGADSALSSREGMGVSVGAGKHESWPASTWREGGTASWDGKDCRAQAAQGSGCAQREEQSLLTGSHARGWEPRNASAPSPTVCPSLDLIPDVMSRRAGVPVKSHRSGALRSLIQLLVLKTLLGSLHPEASLRPPPTTHSTCGAWAYYADRPLQEQDTPLCSVHGGGLSWRRTGWETRTGMSVNSHPRLDLGRVPECCRAHVPPGARSSQVR